MECYYDALQRQRKRRRADMIDNLLVAWCGKDPTEVIEQLRRGE